MSAVSVQEFLTKVAEDEALQAEVAKAMEAKDTPSALLALVNAKGYDFSADELERAVQEMQEADNTPQGSGEMGDRDLDAVAGGVFSFHRRWLDSLLRRN